MWTSFVLASGSPRRRQLLGACGFDFQIETSDVDESQLSAEEPAAYVKRLAREKSTEVFKRLASKGDPSKPTLGADTIVVLDGEILGKPADEAEARGMIKRLAGNTHTVYTAVCVLTAQGEALEDLVASRVRFRHLSSCEVRLYVDLGESLDKAGGYGVQGVGGMLVEDVQGSFTNVIGLPMKQSIALLEQAGVVRDDD